MGLIKAFFFDVNMSIDPSKVKKKLITFMTLLELFVKNYINIKVLKMEQTK